MFPIPVIFPAPIASLDCNTLYPAPLGSASGFKNVSILVLAWSGNINLYVIGTAIAITVIAVITYFLSIPATKIISTDAIIYAVAVP